MAGWVQSSQAAQLAPTLGDWRKLACHPFLSRSNVTSKGLLTRALNEGQLASSIVWPMKMLIESCWVVPYDFIFFIYLFTVLFMFCLIYSLVLAILNVGLTRGYNGVFTALWSSSDLLLTFCNTKSLRRVLKNKVYLRLVVHSCGWGALVLFYKTCSFLT